MLIRALRVVDLWQFSLCNVSSVLDEEILIAVDAGSCIPDLHLFLFTELISRVFFMNNHRFDQILPGIFRTFSWYYWLQLGLNGCTLFDSDNGFKRIPSKH